MVTNLDEKREIKVINRMTLNEYRNAIEQCKYRFISSYTICVDEKKVLQGWLRGYDPAKVYSAALSLLLKRLSVI